MIPDSEQQRIRSVYSEYAESLKKGDAWSPDNPGNKLILEGRDQAIQLALSASGLLPLKEKTILEIGCGTGNNLATLQEWGASPDRIFGVDVIQSRIDAARKLHPHIRFAIEDGRDLSAPTGSCDAVVASLLFSSIEDCHAAQDVAREILRVLKPGLSAVIWYDLRYSNPTNPNVHGLSRRSIRRLFPELEPRLRSITLLPPLARRLRGPLLHLYRPLTGIHALRTHYAGLLLR
jgi:SAM-dependent methyltransferase